MRLGFGLGLGPSRGSSAAWTPAALGERLLLWADATDQATHFEDTAETTPSSGATGPVNWLRDKRGLEGVGIEASPVTGSMYFPASMFRRGNAVVLPGFMPLRNTWGEIRARGISINPQEFTLVIFGRNGSGYPVWPVLSTVTGGRYIADPDGGSFYTIDSGYNHAEPGQTWKSNKCAYILTSDGTVLTSEKDVRSMTLSPSGLVTTPISDPFLIAKRSYLMFEFQHLMIIDGQLTDPEKAELRAFATTEYGVDDAEFGAGKPYFTGLADAIIMGGFGAEKTSWWLEMSDAIGADYRVIPVGATAITYTSAAAILSGVPTFVAGSKYVAPAYTYYDLDSGQTSATIFAGWKAMIDALIAAGWDVAVYCLSDYHTHPTGAKQTQSLELRALAAAEYPTRIMTLTPTTSDDGTHANTAGQLTWFGDVMTHFGF